MLKKKSDANTVQSGPALKVHEYFVHSESKELGLAVADLDGEYGYNKNHKVDQIVFVLEGTLQVEIDGTHHVLNQEDAVLIPKGSWYYVTGKGRFMAITQPAWFFEQYEMRKK